MVGVGGAEDVLEGEVSAFCWNITFQMDGWGGDVLLVLVLVLVGGPGV